MVSCNQSSCAGHVLLADDAGYPISLLPQISHFSALQDYRGLRCFRSSIYMSLAVSNDSGWLQESQYTTAPVVVRVPRRPETSSAGGCLGQGAQRTRFSSDLRMQARLLLATTVQELSLSVFRRPPVFGRDPVSESHASPRPGRPATSEGSVNSQS